MRRATSLLLTYGALVVPAVIVSAGLIEAAPRPAGTTLELQVTGQAGVPADASAVVLNITSAGASGTGYITAWPCGTTRPNASNLNYGVGAPIANSAIVRIGTGGKVCLFTADSATELIVDINGWFPTDYPFTPTSPARLLDTRPGLSTVDAVAAGVGVRRAGGTYELQVTGRSGVPVNASAVVLNITSAEAHGTGFITAWPCGATRPTASNLNYGVGAPVANNAIVKIGNGGKVCLLTADTDTELIADINGWFPAGTDYVSTSPARLLDTRPGLSTVDGASAGQGLRRAGATYELQVAGRAGVPANASAVALNLTSAEARGTGFLTAWPCGTPRPNASNLNYGVGAPVANSAIVKVGAGGKVCLFTGDTDTELIADVNGWFPSGSSYSAITPQRLLDTREVTAGALFVETFDTPSGFYDRFRTDVHFRDAGPNVDRVKTWPGDHNMACQGPTTQRTVSAANEADLFWWCGPGGAETGHLMTSMGDIDGYTILSFSPNQSFVGINRVCWDVNLTYEGGRKWTQVAVIPRAAFEANGSRLDYISPLTQDVDQTAVRLPAGSFMYQNWDGKFRLYQGQTEVLFDWVQFFTSDKAKRYQHCITDNHNGTVTVSRQQDTTTHTRTVNGSLPNDAVVIFQDDNYTPDKDGEAFPNYTWHWDNITIQ